MALGCDTATNVTAARLTTLKNNKFTFVCRYLNRVEGYQDGLTSAEITRISDGDYISYPFIKSANRSIILRKPMVLKMLKRL